MDQTEDQAPDQERTKTRDEIERATNTADQTLKLLLDATKGEYDAEQGRSSTFETRTGMLLALLSALLVYEATTFSLPSRQVSVKVGSFMVAIQLISILAIITAICFSIAVLRPREYLRINVKNMISEIFPGVLMRRLINAYVESIEESEKRTNRRKDHFNIAIGFSVAGVLALAVSRIIQVYAG